jgi:hypothetical protein
MIAANQTSIRVPWPASDAPRLIGCIEWLYDRVLSSIKGSKTLKNLDLFGGHQRVGSESFQNDILTGID